MTKGKKKRMQMSYFMFPTEVWVNNWETTQLAYSRIKKIGKYFVHNRVSFHCWKRRKGQIRKGRSIE